MNLHGIGLGTFPFSNVFGLLDEKEADRITHTFLAHGGTYIQTAPYYRGVDSLMSKILKNVPREKFAWGTLSVKNRQSELSGKYSSVINQCEDSLQTTGLDYVDLYMTSTPAANDAPFSETIGAMVDLKKQGKVREIGVCNVTLAQLQEYNHDKDVKYVQNRFSIIDQKMDLDVREYCNSNDIGLVPYNVIEWGLLTNKILQDLHLRENDLRLRVLPVFGDEPVQVIREWVIKFLQPLADQTHTSIEALAINWVLSQPGVSVCPIGATKNEQILSSLKALELSGRMDVIKEMDKAYYELEKRVRYQFGSELNDYLRNSYGKW